MQIFTCAYCFISNMLLPLYIRTLELVDIWQQHGEHITDVSLQTQRLTLDVVRAFCQHTLRSMVRIKAVKACTVSALPTCRFRHSG